MIEDVDTKKLSERSDEELLRSIAERDDDASAELHRRYIGELTGYIARRVRPVEVEDTVQEVLYRILLSACSYRGKSNVRAWLYGVARQTLWEKFRGRDDPVSSQVLIDSIGGPESLALRTERRRHIVAALERLPDDQGIVLELHRIDGLSHEKIAELLGISVGASRKRLERAARFIEKLAGQPQRPKLRHSKLDSWRRSLLRRAIPAAGGDAERTES